MEKSTNHFAWAHKLGCPPSICNDSVKKVLCAGMGAFLWEELGNVIFTADEVKTVRKNVLLYQLRTETPNKIVQCMQNMQQLKSARKDMKNRISKLEKDYEHVDFALRQKVQKLQDIKSMRSQMKVKKNLLNMKYDQTATQVQDCKKMRVICQRLMPGTSKELDTKLLIETSNTLINLRAGANKREVLDAIKSNLNNIEVPTLWRHLYQNLTQHLDTLLKTLIKSETAKPLNTHIKDINLDIAKIYGEQISMVAKKLWYQAKTRNHQESILEFTEKIEKATNDSEDVITWLALILEICKLETEEKYLVKEISEIREDLNENATFAFNLAELTSEIQNIDKEIVKYTECIQQSFIHFKSLPTHIMKTKDEINLVLQQILELRNSAYDSAWLKNSSGTELNTFYNTLDLNALRKVTLKGDIGTYRHKKRCFAEASVSVTNSHTSNIVCYFPMIQTPIYSLLECYKNLTLTFVYKRFNPSEVKESLDVLPVPVLQHKGNNANVIEILNLSKTANTKTKSEIDKFNKLLHDWVHRTVEKAMDITDNTVDNATFSEWVERYNLLLYIFQKSK
ncbi:uncharacterized protein LOC116424279 isoform X1 [Nomia melanderi]|uniref:uncharacterized protein LOC116424279 isoform X1 n=2 Tax=Nomia melanderi TaxID=2448451 RepID=UPI003FCC51BF